MKPLNSMLRRTISVCMGRLNRLNSLCALSLLLLTMIAHHARAASAPKTAEAPSTPSFEITGTVSTFEYSANTQSNSFSFICDVALPSWSVHVVVLESNEPSIVKMRAPDGHVMQLRTKMPDSQLLCSDGTNFYSLTKAIFYTTNGSKREIIENNANGAIGPGTAPFGAVNDTLLAIWYAFASSEYLSDSESGQLVPLYPETHADILRGDHLVSARWELSPELPHLPRSILMSNYFGWTDNPQSFRKGEFPNTNVDFQVVASTNVFGLSLPLSIQIKYFIPTMRGSQNQTRLAKMITVTGRSYRRLAMAIEVPPAIEGTAVINDLQYWFTNAAHSKIQDVSVVVTNIWPRQTQSEAKYQAIKNYQRGVGNRNSRRTTMLVILIAVAAAPLFLAIVRLITNNQSKSKG